MILDTDINIACPVCQKRTFVYDWGMGKRICVNPLCGYEEDGKVDKLTVMDRIWKWLLEE